MNNAILFKQAHVVAKSMKEVDSTLHYTLCFKEALRMIRESFAAEKRNGERCGYFVGEGTIPVCARMIARNFDEIVEKRAKAAAYANRFVVKTIVRETERAILAKCQQQDGTVEDEQWIPKKCINANGVVADWFLNKNLPAFYQFV